MSSEEEEYSPAAKHVDIEEEEDKLPQDPDLSSNPLSLMHAELFLLTHATLQFHFLKNIGHKLLKLLNSPMKQRK